MLLLLILSIVMLILITNGRILHKVVIITLKTWSSRAPRIALLGVVVGCVGGQIASKTRISWRMRWLISIGHHVWLWL